VAGLIIKHRNAVVAAKEPPPQHGSISSKSRHRMFGTAISSSSISTLDKINRKTGDGDSATITASSLLRVIEFSACSSKRPRSIGNSSSSSSQQEGDQKLHHHHHHHHQSGATVFISDTSSSWKKQDSSMLLQLHDGENADDESRLLKKQKQPPQPLSSLLSSSYWNDFIFHNVIRHFLPAHYPDSVGPGYARFSIYAFGASLAGSAAMVLSTQTLLLAVGVVGAAQTSTTAGAAATSSIMAGALNWVVKDGIGQVGGVVFASRMGQSRRFDDNPKRWRMVAATSLDAASFMEILSPTVWPTLVLPVACCANVLKNIGFLTASASRAALHQSLARRGNLADVTAKSGSQSMAAGLLGTTLGIVLSTTVLQQDPQLFIFGFVALSFFHQVGNYASLKHVGLNHFNRHRLHIVLQDYLSQQQQQVKSDTNMSSSSSSSNNQDDKLMILTPDQVAHCEVYFPLMREDDADTWLSIASGLSYVAPGGPRELTRLLDTFSGESYLINIASGHDHGDKLGQGQGRRVYLTFLEGATGEDLIKGCLHAYLIRQDFDFHKSIGHVDRADPEASRSFHCIERTLAETNRLFPHLLQGMHDCKWKTTADVTNIESSTGFRLAVNRSLPKSAAN
jgi:Vitamin B6 photo-protection and homoeostasis